MIYDEPTKHLYDELFEYIEMEHFIKNFDYIKMK
jgi:hypothetical protein